MSNFDFLHKFFSWSSTEQEEWYNSATSEQISELCDTMRDYEIWLDRTNLLLSLDETTVSPN